MNITIATTGLRLSWGELKIFIIFIVFSLYWPRCLSGTFLAKSIGWNYIVSSCCWISIGWQVTGDYLSVTVRNIATNYDDDGKDNDDEDDDDVVHDRNVIKKNERIIQKLSRLGID